MLSDIRTHDLHLFLGLWQEFTEGEYAKEVLRSLPMELQSAERPTMLLP